MEDKNFLNEKMLWEMRIANLLKTIELFDIPHIKRSEILGFILSNELSELQLNVSVVSEEKNCGE